MVSKSPEITSAFQETQLEVDGLNVRSFGAGQGDPVVVLDTLSLGIDQRPSGAGPGIPA